MASFSPFFLVLALFTVVIITISTTTVVPVSAQDNDDDPDQRYQDCGRQFECGDVQIGYPFWGRDRPSHCGLPDLSLSCTNDNQVPTINILGLSYQLLRADNISQILTLVRTDYQQNLCPANPPNTTIESPLLALAPDSQLVTLYYGCSVLGSGVQAPASLGRINCGGGGSNTGDYFVTSEDLVGGYEAAIRSLLGLCETRVTVPANRTAVAGLGASPTAERLETAIRQGFGVRWTANDGLCATCRTSGGRCGSSEGSFTCYCVDQPYGSECRVPGGAPGPAAAAQTGTHFLQLVFLSGT